MIRVGILGGSGYTGAELLRVLSAHPEFAVAWATGDSQVGGLAGKSYPALGAAYPELKYVAWQDDLVDSIDLLFACLPHGAFAHVVATTPGLLDRVKVVDLSADFRLKRPELYDSWYHAPHPAPEFLDRFTFGLPELVALDPSSRAVAAAGCHVTTASLALGPLVAAGMIESTGIVVNTVTGVSGAGRKLDMAYHFSTVNEDLAAYGLVSHRHTPEIEQVLATLAPSGAAEVIFTPHLAPVTRGLVATTYARPAGGALPDERAVLGALHSAYDAAPFITVLDDATPHSAAHRGANTASVSARVDARTGWVVALGALDNLAKGASGQGVQCANIICGLDPTAGLTRAGLVP